MIRQVFITITMGNSGLEQTRTQESTGWCMSVAYKVPSAETQDLLREYLRYDSDTGDFFWKKDRCYKHNSNRKIKRTNNGYRAVFFKGKSYYLHRVAWFFYYGKWPEDQIDHINGDKLDNKIINLRHVDQSVNMQNTKSHRDGMPIGVFFNKKTKRWWAFAPKKFLKRNSTRNKYIGMFATKELAEQAVIDYCEKGC